MDKKILLSGFLYRLCLYPPAQVTSPALNHLNILTMRSARCHVKLYVPICRLRQMPRQRRELLTYICS